MTKLLSLVLEKRFKLIEFKIKISATGVYIKEENLIQ